MALKFGTSGIRGLNTEFTTQAVQAYIQAFIEHAQTKTAVTEVALAGDLRESTPGITYLVKYALEGLGIGIHDCGALPTPALALYCAHSKVPGIMVTGSHIPADRNGIKFYWPWGEILKEDEAAIVERYHGISKGSESHQEPSKEAQKASRLYMDRYIQFFAPLKKAFIGKTIVVYQHSAVARDFWKPILSELGFKVLEVGRSSIFTPVDTETDEAIHALKKVFDFSQTPNVFAVVSSDGDADRPFLCDEKLQMVRGDTIGVLSAQFLKADVIVTPVSSNTALEKTKAFPKILRTKIGSPFVIEEMGRAEAPGAVVVGYEANGGLLLGSAVSRDGATLLPLPTRDSILPILCCLALAAEKGLSLGELVATLPPRYTDSDLLREYPVDRKDEIYKKALSESSFKTKFMDKYGSIVEQNQIDGLRLTFANGDIVHLRPSGNAPEFRCYAESSSSAQAKHLVSEGIAWLKSVQ